MLRTLLVAPVLLLAAIDRSAGQDRPARLEVAVGSLNSSILNLDKPTLSLSLAKDFSDRFGISAGVARTLGQNYRPHHAAVGKDPSQSKDTIFREWVNSLTAFSLQGVYRHPVSERFDVGVAAGPALFQIHTEHSVEYLDGTSHSATGERIPENTDVTQLGWGGSLRLQAAWKMTRSVRLQAFGDYVFGRYDRKISFQRLKNTALEPVFDAQRGSVRFDGLNLGLGLGFEF